MLPHQSDYVSHIALDIGAPPAKSRRQAAVAAWPSCLPLAACATTDAWLVLTLFLPRPFLGAALLCSERGARQLQPLRSPLLLQQTWCCRLQSFTCAAVPLVALPKPVLLVTQLFR